MAHAILTAEDVQKWRSRIEVIERDMSRLMLEAEVLRKKLEAVNILLGEDGDGPAQFVADESESGAISWGGRPSWPSEIKRIFEDLRTHLSFDQLRAEIEKGALRGEFAKSDKGFYHAISRLQDRDYLVKHRGWLFRKSDFEEHIRNVEAGLKSDIPEAVPSGRRSEMGEAVKRFLALHPNGATSAEIISYLKEDERFRDTLNRNATGAYNVIARLAKRGEIRKEGKVSYPLKKGEPPKGGSEMGEADSSP